MRNRLLVAVAGVVVVGVALAGLLGILDLLAKTGPTATARVPSGVPDVNISGINGAPAPSLSLDISPEGELLPQVPLFNIAGASNTSLLRSTTASTLDGDLWKFDQGAPINQYNGEKLVPPVKGYSQEWNDEIKVTPMQEFQPGMLPVPTSLYPVSISSSVPLYYLPEDQLFISKQGLPESYTFQAVHYKFDETTLNNAEIDPEAQYLQLPSTTTERTKQLAVDITKNLQSPYQKAKAIEQYLKDNYTYDFDYKPAPSGIEPNDWFLFDEKKGVCANFNSAFVMLARSVGIPSRLVGGYAIQPESGNQVVYADQAHAWSEVNFKDLGWITFDATGSSPVPLPTETEITAVVPLVQKGHSFNVQGIVQAKGVTVEGALVEIYLNPKKSNEGGLLIGRGIINQGTFNIEANIPTDENVGNYQIMAHCLGNIQYQESWSDPQVKVVSGTQVNLNVSPKVKVSEPVTVQGKLTEESNQPISGQQIDIVLDKQLITRLNTDEDGQFEWEQSFSKAGDYTIEANFAGTEYYLQSSQIADFQVLIPTTLNLQAPAKAKTGDSLSIEGSLLEEKTGLPVPKQQIEILIDGKSIEDTLTTDENGTFKIDHTFDKAGIYQLEARFSSAPYYWESQSGSVIEILPASGSFPWIYIMIAAILVAGGVGGFFLYRRQRRRPVIAAPLPILSAYKPVVIPPLEEEKPGYGVRLKIEFPRIESPFPDVWGLGDELEVVFHLFNADSVALAAKPLQVFVGKQIAQLTTDPRGAGRLLLTLTEKGQFKLMAKYDGEPGIESAAAQRVLRIVDYREEIVELFKALRVWFRAIGIILAPEATPREIEQKVVLTRQDIPEAALDRAVSCFEEADYSLHAIGRENYKTMYLAQKEMREHDQTPTVNP